MSGESAQFTCLTVGKGLAPSIGEILQIYSVFRRIRKMLRVRIGVFLVCQFLLPEGAEPLPYVHADSLYGFSQHYAMSKICTGPARNGSRALRESFGFAVLNRRVRSCTLVI